MSFLAELQNISGPTRSNRPQVELQKVKSMLRSSAKAGKTTANILIQNRYFEDVVTPLQEEGLNVSMTLNPSEISEDRFIEVKFSW
jgi:hypothetical protein